MARARAICQLWPCRRRRLAVEAPARANTRNASIDLADDPVLDWQASTAHATKFLPKTESSSCDPEVIMAANTNWRDRSRKSADSNDDIQRRAYELYEARGKADGQDLEDWLRAEKELERTRDWILPGAVGR